MTENLQDSSIQAVGPTSTRIIQEARPKWFRAALFAIGTLFVLAGVFYTGTKYRSLEREKGTLPLTSPAYNENITRENTQEEGSLASESGTLEQLTPTPMTATVAHDDEISPPAAPLKPKVTAPATFGFTKVIDLPGIGIRAVFPEKTKITYSDPETNYMANFPDGGIYFSLYGYSGGSRRVWFRENIGRPEGTFESFGANNHQGYLNYSKDSSGNLYNLYYFSVARSNKMLVVDYGVGVGNVNLERFKSFISTLQIIEPNLQGIDRQDQVKFETARWSDTRKTVWERSDLGLRVTAPDWIESRFPKLKQADGTWEYSEWSRIYPEAKTYGGEETDGVFITGLFFGGTHLAFLNPKYTGATFSEVVSSELPGAGFCSTGWKNSKSECGDINPDYCYTKDEVIQSLVSRQTAKFGLYTGQLRGINAGFSQKRDCRGEDIWLIQAKGGQFVLSTIYPDSETIRLEGF